MVTQWVTLLPEACTGAVCSYCLEHHEGVLKCGRCKRAWYCSKEHQKAHYPEHKDTCRVVAPYVEALIDTMQDSQPSTYKDAQRLIGAAAIYASNHVPQGPLRSNIFSCLSNTIFCRVCFKLREQLPQGVRMVCCPKCWWGWCCDQHWAEFKLQHQPFCEQYEVMRRMSLLKRQQAAGAVLGTSQLRYPMGKVSQREQEVLLQQGWESYRRLRVPGVKDDDVWRCMTDDLAVPLTSVAAVQQLYSKQQLDSVQHFVLHLVGAAHYEFQHVLANTAIEEVMHLLPAVTSLHVVLVGPGWRDISPGPTCSSFEKDVCPPCTAAGCTRSVTIYRGTYEDFAASSHWTQPTLALACNSGVGCEDEHSWSKAVKVLMGKDIPCCFTSMNAAELKDDAAALEAAGATILSQGRNMFSSLVPLHDVDAEPDEFYYTNGYSIVCRRAPAGS